jgi:hypothetical protein
VSSVLLVIPAGHANRYLTCRFNDSRNICAEISHGYGMTTQMLRTLHTCVRTAVPLVSFHVLNSYSFCCDVRISEMVLSNRNVIELPELIVSIMGTE